MMQCIHLCEGSEICVQRLVQDPELTASAAYSLDSEIRIVSFSRIVAATFDVVPFLTGVFGGSRLRESRQILRRCCPAVLLIPLAWWPGSRAETSAYVVRSLYSANVPASQPGMGRGLWIKSALFHRLPKRWQETRAAIRSFVTLSHKRRFLTALRPESWQVNLRSDYRPASGSSARRFCKASAWAIKRPSQRIWKPFPR